jgi:hypothetical protein
LVGTWRLEYDSVAAHALLCSIRGSPKAVNRAAKGVDSRCRQAAAFLADIPASLENAGITQANGRGSDEENQARGLIMDALFHAHGKTAKPILDQFLSLKSEHRTGGLAKEQFVVVSRKGSFDDLCSRISSFPSDDDSEEAFMENAISSARAWVRLGKHHAARGDFACLTRL